MQAWEQAWLRVARRLLDDDQHRASCNVALGPEAVARCDAADLRWPGYLGVAYQPGGVLIAMTVHREFGSGTPAMPTRKVHDFVADTRAWRDGRLDDAGWLMRARDFYVTGLSHHWRVGAIARSLAVHAGIGIEQVAYVNTARCQVVESKPKLHEIARIKADVVELCTGEHPLTDVTDAIDPAVVVLPKGTWDLAGTAFGEVPVLAVHQRRGTLCVPHGRLGIGASVRDWTDVVRQLVAQPS